MTKDQFYVEQTCTKILLGLGIPINLQGYRFLRTAIFCVVEDPEIIERVTKELYPKVAEHYNVKPSVIERSIRHAIDTAYDRKGLTGLNKLFDIELYDYLDKPSNSELIALVAEKLLSDLKGQNLDDPTPTNDNNDDNPNKNN